jgi:hypothetical protein
MVPVGRDTGRQGAPGGAASAGEPRGLDTGRGGGTVGSWRCRSFNGCLYERRPRPRRRRSASGTNPGGRGEC